MAANSPDTEVGDCCLGAVLIICALGFAVTLCIMVVHYLISILAWL